MRHLRTLTGLIAAFALVLLAFNASPAQAVAPDTDRAKPKHNIENLRGKEPGNKDWFVVLGKVTTYKGKVLKLQRSKKGKGNWSTIKSTRTSKKNGSFKMRFDGPSGTCYRIAVPKTPRNKYTTKRFGCIYTTG